MIKIKYKPTGNIFTLPDEEATKIYVEDKGFNYEVIEGKIKLPATTTEKTSVYNQIVEEEVKPLDEYSYQELKKYCKDNKLSTAGKADELLARAKEFSTLLALRQKYENVTGKTATEEMKAEDIEAEIIEALTEKVKEKDIEIQQNPVTIEYLEELLSDGKIEE